MSQADITVWQSAGTCAGGVAESLSLQGESNCQAASLLTDENKHHQVAIRIRGKWYTNEFLSNAYSVIIFVRKISVEGTPPCFYLFFKERGRSELV